MAATKGKVDPKKEAQELRTMIARAKDGPINFGLALAKGKGEPAFMVHNNKKSDALRKEAKNRTGGQKCTKGTLQLDGKVLTLKCEEEPPSQLVRLMKGYFKDKKLPFKVSVETPDGQVLSDDEEEAAAAGEAEGSAAEGDGGPAMAAAAAVPDDLFDMVAEVAENDPTEELRMQRVHGLDQIETYLRKNSLSDREIQESVVAKIAKLRKMLANPPTDLDLVLKETEEIYETVRQYADESDSEDSAAALTGKAAEVRAEMNKAWQPLRHGLLEDIDKLKDALARQSGRDQAAEEADALEEGVMAMIDKMEGGIEKNLRKDSRAQDKKFKLTTRLIKKLKARVPKEEALLKLTEHKQGPGRRAATTVVRALEEVEEQLEA